MIDITKKSKTELFNIVDSSERLLNDLMRCDDWNMFIDVLKKQFLFTAEQEHELLVSLYY